MANLVERLQQLQTEKSSLKKDIAARLGISVMAFYRYEHGERQLPTDKLIALADYFGVSIDYLVGRTDNPEINK